MIALRLDPRVSPRLDASDVVQETLADAAGKLEGYLRERPLPFYPWLHRLAAEQLARTHRRHIASTVRSVRREQPEYGRFSEGIAGTRLVDRLLATDTTPGHRLVREERRRQVVDALARLGPTDRELLVLRYVDQLGFAEIAALLEIEVGAAKMRHLRALERLRLLLEETGVGPSTGS